MSSADTLFAITFYAVGVNLTGFLAFAWDKHCAINRKWRVAERTLLTLAAVGGTVGVVIGQQALRHKTSKEPFRTYLLLILIAQVIVVLALCVPQVRSALWAFAQQSFG